MDTEKKTQDVDNKRLQILVAALNENTTTLANRMGLECDAIVINQCNETAESMYHYKSYQIKCYHRESRGVGRSRNEALEHADAALLLFSDEDIVYRPGYAKEVIAAFDRNPQADLILFNVRQSEGRETYQNKDNGRVRWYNYGRYPAYAVAARTQRLKESGVRFSLLFGGGADYSNVEDSLFLRDCLRKDLRIYRNIALIGCETKRDSTWFEGYTDRFFHDRGVLYHYLYGRMAYPFALRWLIKNRASFCAEKPFAECKRLLKEGIAHGRVSDSDNRNDRTGVADGT